MGSLKQWLIEQLYAVRVTAADQGFDAELVPIWRWLPMIALPDGAVWRAGNIIATTFRVVA